MGVHAGINLEAFPIFLILPFEQAKRLMLQCAYDLELFSKRNLSVGKDGGTIKVHETPIRVGKD